MVEIKIIIQDHGGPSSAERTPVSRPQAAAVLPFRKKDFSRVLVPCENEKDVPTRTANIRAELNRLFERGAGNHGATRFDAFQAVSDYADHVPALNPLSPTQRGHFNVTFCPQRGFYPTPLPL